MSLDEEVTCVAHININLVVSFVFYPCLGQGPDHTLKISMTVHSLPTVGGDGAMLHKQTRTDMTQLRHVLESSTSGKIKSMGAHLSWWTWQ